MPQIMNSSRLLGRGMVAILIVIAGALSGAHSASHGDPRNWGRIANGQLLAFAWGWAAVAGTLLLLLLTVMRPRTDARRCGALAVILRSSWFLVVGALSLGVTTLLVLPFFIVF